MSCPRAPCGSHSLSAPSGSLLGQSVEGKWGSTCELRSQSTPGKPALSGQVLVLKGRGTAPALGTDGDLKGPVPNCFMVPVPCAVLEGLRLDSQCKESGVLSRLRSERAPGRPALCRQALGSEGCGTN